MMRAAVAVDAVRVQLDVGEVMPNGEEGVPGHGDNSLDAT